jgi:hypothetical protein
MLQGYVQRVDIECSNDSRVEWGMDLVSSARRVGVLL